VSHSENAPRRSLAHPQSAPGDFYVVKDQCIACGAPHAVAPDVIGWATVDANDEPHCIWKKQPETPGEWEQAFMAFAASEIGCYRYAGADPDVMNRLGHQYCDQAEVSKSIANQHVPQTAFLEKKVTASVDISFTLKASRSTRIGSAVRSIVARFWK
jgi:hypothetical protein